MKAPQSCQMTQVFRCEFIAFVKLGVGGGGFTEQKKQKIFFTQ